MRVNSELKPVTKLPYATYLESLYAINSCRDSTNSLSVCTSSLLLQRRTGRGAALTRSRREETAVEN